MNEITLFTAVLVTLLLIFAVWGRWWRERLAAAVQVVTLRDFASRHLDNVRDVQVFLPPGYAGGTEHYPALYLNDGQDVGQLGLRETLARLMARGQIVPLLVVAIPTNEERLQEYGTAVSANAQGFGTKAALYNRFVTEELRPYINREFRGREGGTAVLGASLGGLSAFDLAWNHPDLFGAVGVFSGSFWWRAGEDATEIPPGKLIAHEMVRQGSLMRHASSVNRHLHGAQMTDDESRMTDDGLPAMRFWFEAGTQDEASDRDDNGVIDAIQDTQELIDELAALGYEYGRDVVYVEVLGGRHNYHTWAEVLPQFLIWAFPS